MIAVFQEGPSDCFRANLATLLGKSLHDVPDFMEGQDKYFTDAAVAVMDRWLACHDLALIRFPIPYSEPSEALGFLRERQPPGVSCILAGLTQKGVEHSWVVQGGEIVHDPARPPQNIYAALPYGDGVELFYVFFLIPLLGPLTHE